MDTVRKEDGRPVMLKKVLPEEGRYELSITELFSSPGLRGDPKNHCVPLLELIDLSQTNPDGGKLMAMPFLRPFKNPRFQTCLSRQYNRRRDLGGQAFARDEMDPTLSSWLKNMNKLSSLIDRLEELASSAPEELRSQLSRQVTMLRATFKKQQERCIDFLQLSEEYADKYLLNISAEIRQQSSFLDMLEKRLDMAKTLRQHAVDLRRSYESGTAATMKDVRTTGKALFCCL